ncbi:MAG: YggS family pyridoxal phosphate-dependent enzyme [Acidobacteria bacterium]|nr:YggS family pyridoxal phosphate-dependent enzyme [Acidobacteriota bacterium]
MTDLPLQERLEAINKKIAAACQRAGRDFFDVTLVAVSKTVEPARIRLAIEAGVRMLGENRVQEAAAKMPELATIVAEHHVQWHLIGHLQSNKARRAVELFSTIQTVDSFKLAERLNNIAGGLGKRLPVFIEVNLGGEESKEGATPDEVLPLSEQVVKLANLELKGLMAVPPFVDDPEEVRPFFRRLRILRDQAQLKELSMGMSHDFEVAIEEGATIVRIGTALFGERT